MRVRSRALGKASPGPQVSDSERTTTRKTTTDSPYTSLEPEGPDPRSGGDPAGEDPPNPLYPETGILATLVRGVRRRCPRCGDHDTFLSWFRMRQACPRCEWRFEKEEGGYLGAMVLNYVVAVGLWVAVPDVPVLPLTIASVAVLVLAPLAFYPRSKMIWAAVEYLTLRADPDYRPPTHRDPRAKRLE